MNQDSKRTCRTIVLLIKRFAVFLVGVTENWRRGKETFTMLTKDREKWHRKQCLLKITENRTRQWTFLDRKKCLYFTFHEIHFGAFNLLSIQMSVGFHREIFSFQILYAKRAYISDQGSESVANSFCLLCHKLKVITNALQFHSISSIK